nr:MAG TPA: hypothetical protein [Caudoviricetes sp.]
MSRMQWNGRVVTNDVVGDAGSWRKCSDGEGGGWIIDGADLRDAAEYPRAVAH